MTVTDFKLFRNYNSRLFILRMEHVILTLIFLLFVSEVFSGLLRYYLNSIGLVYIIYMPKAACLAFVFLHLLYAKTDSRLWISLLVFVVSSLVGFVNGANINNFMFALYAYCPLFLGMLSEKYIGQHYRVFTIIIFFLFLGSVLGVFLDAYITVPWKGFSYSIGGSEIEANREWSYAGVDRIAGFARVSSVLSVFLSDSAENLAVQGEDE